MLQPVMAKPSTVSSAAPTLKPEYCAWAWLRASAAAGTGSSSRPTALAGAASTETGCHVSSSRRSLPDRRVLFRRSAGLNRVSGSAAARTGVRRSRRRRSFDSLRSTSGHFGRPAFRSELPNDSLQQRAKARAHPPRHFHDLVMDERLREHARRGIRDAGDTEDLHPHVPGDDGFGHGGHAYRVGADFPEVRDLGRRLITRAVKRDIDAVSEREADLPGCAIGQPAQAARIDL